MNAHTNVVIESDAKIQSGTVHLILNATDPATFKKVFEKVITKERG